MRVQSDTLRSYRCQSPYVAQEATLRLAEQALPRTFDARPVLVSINLYCERGGVLFVAR